MEPLSWTGALSFLTLPLFGAVILTLALGMLRALLGLVRAKAARARTARALRWSLWLIPALLLAYIVLGALIGPAGGIVGALSQRFWPVWIALAVTFALSIRHRHRLGLYGRLFESPLAMVGFALVMFWLYTALFSGLFGLIQTHAPLDQMSGMKNKLPGTPVPGVGVDAGAGGYPWYLLGGDNLARDVFSRMVVGAGTVMQIAPLATLFAFMAGMTLGLPAGYHGGRADTVLSFTANLILAFPVILLFYLLVTPEIRDSGLPNYMAAVLFLFPLVFVGVLLNARFHTRPRRNLLYLGGAMAGMFWAYLTLISDQTTAIRLLPAALDAFDIDPGMLAVFVAVVFVNAPTVFRITRGLAMDIKTRDYVAAAQTRGESAWYIMLWEILPNARGPLIVDFCLRIGYTTILLGTLGFFGLGLAPESPDWGTTINDGRKLLSIYPHPALAPALALLSLVLGLNLLADGLREQSLKD